MEDTETPSVITKLLRAVKNPSRGLANVHRLIPECSQEELSEALVKAAHWGKGDVVQLFLPLCDPKDRVSCALLSAARAGHLDVVQQLLPKCDRAANGDALFWAAHQGHADVVRSLVASDAGVPRDSALHAVYAAVPNGHAGVVRELLAACGPDADFTPALREAAQEGRLDLVGELAPASDVAGVFEAETRQLTRIARENGLETARQSRSLLIVRALVPHVDEGVLEQALRVVLDIPAELIRLLPRFDTLYAAKRWGEPAPQAEVLRLH